MAGVDDLRVADASESDDCHVESLEKRDAGRSEEQIAEDGTCGGGKEYS